MWEVVAIGLIDYGTFCRLLFIRCVARDAGIGFVGVSSVASAAAVSVRVRSLCRDLEDTWWGRGSKKGLVVIRLIGGNGSHGGELFRVS